MTRTNLWPCGKGTDLLDYATNNRPSIFVGTSTSPRLASGFAGEGGYVYTLRPGSGAVNVNSALGAASPFPFEKEVVIPGGIRAIDIKGARVVGSHGEFTGLFVPNPYYQP